MAPTPKPTIGRIVHYFPNDAARIDITRLSAGNSIVAGEPIAAVIVKVWTDTMVNLKLLTDGRHDVWMTSVPYSELPGGNSTWAWPEMVR